MATRVWISTSSTDWNSTSNWSGGSVPTTGDIAVFDGTGTANATTNMNQTAVALNRLIVYPAYAGTIGAVGAPLQIDVNNSTNPFLLFMGTGQLFQVGTVTKAIVNSTSAGSPAATFGISGTSKTISELVCANGLVTVNANTTVTLLNVIYGSSSGNVTTTLKQSSAVTTANMTGGNVTCEIAPTTMNIDGGTWSNVVANSGTITTLNLRGTGVFQWTLAGQTITNLNMFASSTFDASTLKAGTTTTVTNATRYSSSANMRINNGRAITWTNNIINVAGSLNGITADVGSTLAIS